MWQLCILFLLVQPGQNLTFLGPKQPFHTFIITGICISSPSLPFPHLMLLLKQPQRESLWKGLRIRYCWETKFSWFLQHFKQVEHVLLNFFYSTVLLFLKAKETSHRTIFENTKNSCFFLHLLSFPWNNTYVLWKYMKNWVCFQSLIRNVSQN